MAHADYHCCACCDSKQSYCGFDATTKEIICASCAVGMAKRGVFVTSGQELVAWMGLADPSTAVAILKEVGFQPCFYPNAVDDAANKIADWKRD